MLFPSAGNRFASCSICGTFRFSCRRFSRQTPIVTQVRVCTDLNFPRVSTTAFTTHSADDLDRRAKAICRSGNELRIGRGCKRQSADDSMRGRPVTGAMESTSLRGSRSAAYDDITHLCAFRVLPNPRTSPLAAPPAAPERSPSSSAMSMVYRSALDARHVQMYTGWLQVGAIQRRRQGEREHRGHGNRASDVRLTSESCWPSTGLRPRPDDQSSP